MSYFLIASRIALCASGASTEPISEAGVAFNRTIHHLGRGFLRWLRMPGI